jgi:hypothetical protein
MPLAIMIIPFFQAFRTSGSAAVALARSRLAQLYHEIDEKQENSSDFGFLHPVTF